MAKTSIYLPDDLAEQVRACGIPVSEVAQAALRQAVKAAQIKESVMTDIQAVADRLNATRIADAEPARARAAEVRAYGAKWARTIASAAELEHVVTYNDDPEDFKAPRSLMALIRSEDVSMPFNPEHGYWQDFRAGAREVWKAVQPLLIEIDERGQPLPSGSGGYSETVNPEHRLWLEREPKPDAPQEEHARWAAEEPDEFL